jgi:dTDP-4-dehydrorhamnose reductase
MNPNSRTRVLILGATGLLGKAMLRLLADCEGMDVHGAVRSAATAQLLPEPLRPRVQTGVDVVDADALTRLLLQLKPAVVINCAGMVKQLAESNDPLAVLPVNAVLPHRLSRLCALIGARLIHISTDCVFAGTRGGYREDDTPDAVDLYGRSKLIGEVIDQPHAVTLRTSFIGHELGSRRGLVEWFLSQGGTVRGYSRAVFSGLPTVELAGIIRDHVLPQPQLHGLYQVSAPAIDKLSLLRLVTAQYERHVKIIPDDELIIDRSLDSTRFRQVTGYEPPPWPELVRRMHAFR